MNTVKIVDDTYAIVNERDEVIGVIEKGSTSGWRFTSTIDGHSYGYLDLNSILRQELKNESS